MLMQWKGQKQRSCSVLRPGAVCLVCFTTLVSAVSGLIDLLEKSWVTPDQLNYHKPTANLISFLLGSPFSAKVNLWYSETQLFHINGSCHYYARLWYWQTYEYSCFYRHYKCIYNKCNTLTSSLTVIKSNLYLWPRPFDDVSPGVLWGNTCCEAACGGFGAAAGYVWDFLGLAVAASLVSV